MAKKITGIAKKMKRNVFLVQLGVAQKAANDKIGAVEPQKADTQERSEHFSDVNVEKEKEKVLLISSAYAVVYPARQKYAPNPTDNDDPSLECRFDTGYNGEHETASSGCIFLKGGGEEQNILTITTCVCFYIQFTFFFGDLLQEKKQERTTYSRTNNASRLCGR